MNAVGTGDRLVGIEAQAVDLHDAGVGLNRRQLDAGTGGSLEQPRRDLRPHDHAQAGLAIDQGVDQFNRTGSVAEAMA